MKIIMECSVEEFKTLLKKEPQENEAQHISITQSNEIDMEKITKVIADCKSFPMKMIYQ
ncbi:hypothetical protein I3300191I4_09400 [Megasphaera elsdenii]